jgi:hypothetical protein
MTPEWTPLFSIPITMTRPSMDSILSWWVGESRLLQRQRIPCVKGSNGLLAEYGLDAFIKQMTV